MKILVTGYTGQLGYDVVQHGLRLGLDMIGVGSDDLNITNKGAVSRYIRTIRPDAIIHCAAFTAVDLAEDDRKTCQEVNVLGTENLAEVAKEIDAKFIYISTDYVFSGKGQTPFKEEDKPSPIGHYGRTKLRGEEIVERLLEKWFILRISWVFGINGNNFVTTMLRLGEIKDEINVVGDQIGSPTYTLDVAHLLIEMVKTNKYGIYHASNEGFCSWFDFAKEIYARTNNEIKVNSILTEDYPTRAERPKNSRMSKEKLIKNGFKPLPIWQNALERYLNQLKQEVK